MQWLMCSLHASKLPLRHLSIAIDGITPDLRVFSVTIGKAQKNCHELDVLNYESI